MFNLFPSATKVLTKHCLALVQMFNWIFSTSQMYFLKMYKSALKQHRVAASTANPFVNSQYLNYIITLLLSDKRLPRIQRVQIPVMPHPWMQLHISTDAVLKQANQHTFEVATRYTFSVSLSLNCTQHSAVKWKISYHYKVTRVSQCHLIIYNIQPWNINVDMSYSD